MRVCFMCTVVRWELRFPMNRAVDNRLAELEDSVPEDRHGTAQLVALENEILLDEDAHQVKECDMEVF